MKKLICLIGGILILFNITGCNNRLYELDKTVPSEQKAIEDMGTIILNALERKDVEALKTVLSKDALKSADLDDGIEYCFELYNGTIKSIEKIGCPVETSYSSDGNTKMLEGNYIITTENEKQLLLHFEYWIIEEIAPEKLGVNYMKLSEVVPRSENESDTKYNRAGIYNSAWDESENAITN